MNEMRKLMESLRKIEESVNYRDIDTFIAWLKELHGDDRVKVDIDRKLSNNTGLGGIYHISTPVSNMRIFHLSDGEGTPPFTFNGYHNGTRATTGERDAKTLKFWYNRENKALKGKNVLQRR